MYMSQRCPTQDLSQGPSGSLVGMVDRKDPCGGSLCRETLLPLHYHYYYTTTNNILLYYYYNTTTILCRMFSYNKTTDAQSQ